MGNEKESKPKQGGSNSLILVVILLLVLLVLGGGGVAAFMMLSGGEEKAQNQSNNSGAWVEGQEDQAKSKKRSQAIYYKLKPTFMVKVIEKRRNAEMQKKHAIYKLILLSWHEIKPLLTLLNYISHLSKILSMLFLPHQIIKNYSPSRVREKFR